MIHHSYIYDKFLFQLHQAILSFTEEEKTLKKEEYRRLLLIDEFIKIVMQSNTINWENINLCMQMNFRREK
jgi:hypothetical protein